ncbi:MAG: glycosyltransferase, partial [Pseudomonadota bacterium]
MNPRNNPPYKTVITLQDLEFGGTQRYAIHLLKHLDRDLFDAELWVLRGGEDMLSLAQSSGLPVRYLSKNSWVTPWALWKFFWRLKRHQPDVLYTMTGVPNIWGRIFGALVLNSTMVASWRGLKEKQYESILRRYTDLLICNADALREFVIGKHGVDPERVVVVPNGVDTSFFTPDPSCLSKNPTVVFVGRLVKEKDPLCLIEAFGLLRKVIPEARLVMVGHGYMQPSVQQKLVTSQMSDHVELVRGA